MTGHGYWVERTTGHGLCVCMGNLPWPGGAARTTWHGLGGSVGEQWAWNDRLRISQQRMRVSQQHMRVSQQHMR
eukprot:82665-Chlamydomonas_euryale.AAC.1